MAETGPESELLDRAGRGDRQALQALFARFEGRLKRMVRLRLDARVQGRLDPSDIVQDAYLEVCAKLNDYLNKPTLPFFLWLRLMAGQKPALAHRQHLGVQARHDV